MRFNLSDPRVGTFSWEVPRALSEHLEKFPTEALKMFEEVFSHQIRLSLIGWTMFAACMDPSTYKESLSMLREWQGRFREYEVSSGTFLPRGKLQ